MRSRFFALALSLGVALPVLADPPSQTVYDSLIGVRADADLSILAQILREAFAEEDLIRFFACPDLQVPCTLMLIRRELRTLTIPWRHASSAATPHAAK